MSCVLKASHSQGSEVKAANAVAAAELRTTTRCCAQLQARCVVDGSSAQQRWGEWRMGVGESRASIGGIS
jgi:hypothetical protein